MAMWRRWGLAYLLLPLELILATGADLVVALLLTGLPFGGVAQSVA